MIKTELEKLKTNVDSILNSMENLKAKTDSDDQILTGLATDLPEIFKDSATRLKMEDHGFEISSAISKYCEVSAISRLSILGDNLTPYLTGVLPGILAIKNTHYNWQAGANLNRLSESDGLLTKVAIGLLTARTDGSVNIFGHHLRYEKVSGDIKEVTKFTSYDVTLANSTTTYDTLKDYTIYVVSGTNTGIYCKSHTIRNNGNAVFVECNPTDILTKIGNLKTD